MGRRTNRDGESKTLTESDAAWEPEQPRPSTEREEGAEATDRGAWARVAEASGRTDERVELRRGDRLQKFLILDRLGSGGMGVVFAAHDPDLDRKVAIKVLNEKGNSERARRARRIRLQREAQAAARITHPNVITVHEVGMVDEQVFVAMEYVDGPTLGKWVSEEKPDWRRIVAAYLEAARGLAAAHEAGLVHRDFKPANVLVGSDGRVRVTDFGLVGTAGDAAETSAAREAGVEATGGGALRAALTVAGQVMGTPAYMAPEQHRGEKTDARADQFAFCVSLYEALYGERPFSEAGSREELAASVCRGEIEDPPRDSDVPAWIRRVLVRGLRVDPDDRYRNMAAVIEALQQDPAIARRRAGLLAGVALLAGLAIFGLIRGFGTDYPPLCKGAGEKLEGVWDEAVKQQARAAFVETGIPYAADTFDRAAGALDAYAGAWVAMRTEACEATHVRGEQSDVLLDARMNCLDRRLGEVRALTDLFTHAPDKDVVNSAVRVTLELTPLDGCADREALLAAVPLPDDPAVRARVSALRAELDDAEALEKIGKYADAIHIAEAVRDEAKTIGYEPLLAEALFILGNTQSDSSKGKEAEESLRAAANAAAVAQDDRLIARAWTKLVLVVGSREARYSDALQIADLAATSVARSGDDPALRGELLKYHADVLRDLGRYEEALVLSERAVDELERGYGKVHPSVARGLIGLAAALNIRGEGERAEQAMRRALEIDEKVFGPDHIDVAYPLEGLAGLLMNTRPEEALRYAKRGLAIRERALAAEDPDVASALRFVGMAYAGIGDYAKARVALERAVDIWQNALGPDHPEIAEPREGLAWVLLMDGKLDEADDQLDRVLKIRTEALGPNHPELSYPLMLRADIAGRREDWAKAEAFAKRALHIAEKSDATDTRELAHILGVLGSIACERKQWKKCVSTCRRSLELKEKLGRDGQPGLAGDLSYIGQALIGLGRAGEAVAPLERAYSLASGPNVRGLTGFDLARALWNIGRDRKRALRLAQQARVELKKLGADGRDDLAKVNAWLAERGIR